MTNEKHKLNEEWNVGVDTMDHYKFKLYSLEDYPHFYKRVFTQQEFDYATRSNFPHIRFAGIFAAKEALYKALSAYGLIPLSQIEIDHLDTGQPVVRDKLHPNLIHSRIKVNKNLFIARVSISHAAFFSIAFAVVAPFKKIQSIQQV